MVIVGDVVLQRWDIDSVDGFLGRHKWHQFVKTGLRCFAVDGGVSAFSVIELLSLDQLLIQESPRSFVIYGLPELHVVSALRTLEGPLRWRARGQLGRNLIRLDKAS